MERYTRKVDGQPATAMQWTGTNVDEMAKFVKDRASFARSYFAEGKGEAQMTLTGGASGDVKCHPDDMIVRCGGQLYPVRPEMFEQNYEKVD